MSVSGFFRFLLTTCLQSVATEKPFNPATDVELGIAYIAVFIMIMNVSE